MRLWPFGKAAPATEQRAATTFTQREVDAAYQRATSGGRAGDLAVVQACAGLLERCLTMADVTAPPWAQPAIMGALPLIGRSLIDAGESFHVIEVDGAGLRLLPATSVEADTGDADRRTWVWRTTVHGPGVIRTMRTRDEQLVRIAWNTSVDRPWRGRSGAAVGSATADLATAAERALTSESRVPVARIAVHPHPAAEERGRYAAEIAKGGVLSPAADSMTPGQFTGAHHYDPAAVGPAPDEWLVSARDRAMAETAEALGVPCALILPGAPGTAARDGWRRFHVSTLRPLARIVATELAAKLEADVSINLDALQPADAAAADARVVQSRARAVDSLVKAGMTIADARAVAGL